MDPLILRWGLPDICLNCVVAQMLQAVHTHTKIVYMPAFLATQLCHGLSVEDRFRHWLSAS